MEQEQSLNLDLQYEDVASHVAEHRSRARNQKIDSDFEAILQEERENARLAEMEEHARTKRNIQKRARAKFDAIIQEEHTKAQVSEMESHTRTSRKIQKRAMAEFDKIIAQERANKQLMTDMESHVQVIRNTKKRAQAEFDKIIMEESEAAKLDEMAKHAETSRKIQKKARDEFNKILEEEAQEAAARQMKSHADISRKIQARARANFDKIVAENKASETVDLQAEEPAKTDNGLDAQTVSDMRESVARSHRTQERAAANFDRIIKEEREKNQLAEMEQHVEIIRKTKKKAMADFEAIIQEEQEKSRTRQMDDHVEKSRKIQQRARAQFDAIIAENTISDAIEGKIDDMEAEFAKMENKAAAQRKARESAKEYLSKVIAEHSNKEDAEADCSSSKDSKIPDRKCSVCDDPKDEPKSNLGGFGGATVLICAVAIGFLFIYQRGKR